MKKNKDIILKIGFGIVIIIALFFLFRIYQFNTLSANVELFNTNISEDTDQIGLVDDKYYLHENGQVKGYDQDGQLFSRQVQNLVQAIYHKKVYLFMEDGTIEILNRNSGELDKSVKIEKNIEFAELEGNQFIIYTKDSVIIADEDLKDLQEKTGYENPVDYAFQGEGSSIVEMSLEDGQVISNFSVFNGQERSFFLSSSRETFLYTVYLNGKNILVSNAYIYVISNGAIEDKILLEDIDAIDSTEDSLVIVDNQNLKIFDNNLDLVAEKALGQAAKKVYIRPSTIVIEGVRDLMVYQSANLISTPISGQITTVANDQAVYIVFPNRIEQVNAY